MERMYFIYILTNAWHTVFYTGVTNDLIRRVFEHRTHLIKGFTDRYNIYKLVYFETTNDINAAIYREKIIKKWKRAYKFDAIGRMNPDWKDLYFDIAGDAMEMPQQVRHDNLEGDPATSAG